MWIYKNISLLWIQKILVSYKNCGFEKKIILISKLEIIMIDNNNN